MVAHCIVTMANGAEATMAGERARARASMPAMATDMRTARRPAAVVSMLVTTNSTPPNANTRPIWPGDAPATCNTAGTRRAETPVVAPAVTMAAAATIVRRSAMAARRLPAHPGRGRGRDDPQPEQPRGPG